MHSSTVTDAWLLRSRALIRGFSRIETILTAHLHGVVVLEGQQPDVAGAAVPRVHLAVPLDGLEHPAEVTHGQNVPKQDSRAVRPHGDGRVW